MVNVNVRFVVWQKGYRIRNPGLPVCAAQVLNDSIKIQILRQ
jgi:hypothetical protein